MQIYVPLDITYYPGKNKIGIFGESYTTVLSDKVQ